MGKHPHPDPTHRPDDIGALRSALESLRGEMRTLREQQIEQGGAVARVIQDVSDLHDEHDALAKEVSADRLRLAEALTGLRGDVQRLAPPALPSIPPASDPACPPTEEQGLPSRRPTTLVELADRHPLLTLALVALLVATGTLGPLLQVYLAQP